MSDCLKEKVGMQGSRLMGAGKATTSRKDSIRERKMALQQDVSNLFDINPGLFAFHYKLVSTDYCYNFRWIS